MSKEYEIKTKIEQEQWLLLQMLFLLGYNLKICLMQGGGIDFWWEGIFLGGEEMSKFLAGGESIHPTTPPHLPSPIRENPDPHSSLRFF